MTYSHGLLALLMLAVPATASAQSQQLQRGEVPTTSVRGCVGGNAVNDHVIRQNADINMAACVQAGRQNSVVIEQNGGRNTARSSQRETRQRR